MLFAETSAKKDINVDMMFKQSALQIVEKLEAGIICANSSNGVKMEYWRQRKEDDELPPTFALNSKGTKKRCAC